jgi:hypothetical protein
VAPQFYHHLLYDPTLGFSAVFLYPLLDILERFMDFLPTGMHHHHIVSFV